MTKKIEKKFNRGDKVQSRRGVDDSFDGIGYIIKWTEINGEYLCYFPQPKELKMKITVKTPAPKTVKKTYPYFGKFASGQVVLFFEENTGISVDKLPGVFKKDWNETSAKVLEHFEATFSV